MRWNVTLMKEGKNASKDQECVWDRIGQATRRSPSGATRGFTLILVSGVGEAVGDEKIGGNGVEGTLNNDVTCGEMTFGHTRTNRQALEP